MSVNTYTPGSSKPLVIYHGNCVDGFSAAWCFWDLYKHDMEYYPGVYQQNPPDVAGRVVYMVDFSYKSSVIEKMLDQARCIVVIDHHISAVEDLRALERRLENTDSDKWSRFDTFFNIEKSGATLAWDFLQRSLPEGLKANRPLLLGHIEDRDLWRFKLPNTREIQANVFSYEYTFENWDRLMSAGQKELLEMTVAGAAIERKHHKDIKELIDVCKRFMVIGGFTVPTASLPYTLTSDAGHLLAKEYLGGEAFAACYWDTRESRIFSLRSCDNGMDVSEIAKQYGGGGHKHAAGFKVPRNHELAIC